MSRLSIGQAWDEAKAIYAREKRLIVPVALTMLVLPTAIIGMISGGSQRIDAKDMTLATSLVVLLLTLVTAVGNLGIARLALSRGESVGEALRVAFTRLWPLIGAFFILALPFAIAVVALLVASGVDPAAAETGKISGGVALALLALLVVLLLIAIRLMPLNVLAVAEDGGSVHLLRRSFDLTRGHFWKLLGFLVLALVAILILSAAVGIVAGLLVSLAGADTTSMSLGALLIGLVNGTVQAIAGVAFLLMIVSIYRQLTAAEASVPHVG